jgi:hypothetical protein
MTIETRVGVRIPHNVERGMPPMTIALSVLFFITFYKRLERDEHLSGV